jgi:hypothetical protein
VTRLRGLRSPLLAVCAAALLLPAVALGQAPRTWVSGVGDDANPCARTAPCKTIAGTLQKTAVSGEINVLDPGDFGQGVTITKSITISAVGVVAALSPGSGLNGVNINAPGKVVTLEGFEVNGRGTGLVGVNVTAAKEVRLVNDDISGFATAGVEFAPSDTTAPPELVLENTTIHDNAGDGLLANAVAGTAQTILLSSDTFDGNACGIVATSLGLQGTPDFSTDCGTNTSGSGTGTTALTAVNDLSTSNTGAGLLANGSGGALTVTSDTIDGNGMGLQEANGGTIDSFGGLVLFGNGSDGSPTTSSNPDLGPTGQDGGTGANGTPGDTGATGQPGPAGGSGTSGRAELLTCTIAVSHHARCHGKLLTRSGRFTGGTSSASAAVSQHGRVVAHGTALISSSGLKLILGVGKQLKAGSYKLTLSRKGRAFSHESLTLR